MDSSCSRSVEASGAPRICHSNSFLALPGDKVTLSVDADTVILCIPVRDLVPEMRLVAEFVSKFSKNRDFLKSINIIEEK